MTISEKMIDVEGHAVHYFESGEANGRTLLLLSGGLGDARSNWSTVIDPLAEEYHVIAPDLPGFSGSEALAEMSIDGLVHWLKALLDALEQSDAVIVGHFLGALLARLFAAAAPEYVPVLILSDGGTFPALPPLAARLMRLPVVGKLAFELFRQVACNHKTLAHMVYDQATLTDDLKQAWRDDAAAFTRLICTFLLQPSPQKQTPLVPTLLLWGAEDSFMPLTQAERLQREIPGARLVPIAECGALPAVETSDVFVFQVQSFLNELSRATIPIPARHGVAMLQALEV